MSDRVIVRCGACGTENRVPLDRLGGRERPVCGRCRAALQIPDGAPKNVSDADFASFVTASSVPVLVDCWAPWCGPCRAVAPVLDRIAAAHRDALVVVKLNVDDNPLTAGQYDVSSIPTLLLFTRGKLVDRTVGAQSEAALRGWLQGHGIR